MDIAPDKQNIDNVFGNKQYHIDFYQREYKWTTEVVKRLLDDIFYQFNEAYQKNNEIGPSIKNINSKYPWYYLNTYVTNSINGRIYIVDGQQRLTTLTLILINMYHHAKAYKSELDKWLDNKICGQAGFEKVFWMNHEKHLKTLVALYEGKTDGAPIDSGITAKNMVDNYKAINDWVNKNIQDKNQLETFIFYFLYRLVLINLAVEQTDVPMVFEVINDRGVRLKPYEILKGKLLGQIDKELLDEKQYNQLWEDKIKKINQLKDDEADRFFRFYLKARFSKNRNDAQRYDGEYHRIMFSKDFQQNIKLDHNCQGAMDFLEGDFAYYAALYVKLSFLLQEDVEGSFAFNQLNGIDGVLLLGLAICQRNDWDEEQKIHQVAKELDRLFSLLRLQGAYDSNEFQDIIHRIANKIRDADIDSIRVIFDDELKHALEDKLSTRIDEPLTYTLFKATGDNLNPTFKRYFFARIEGFLAEHLQTRMRHSYRDLVTKTGSKNGFHIEHILSNNEENKSYFSDEEIFWNERNRLGGLLLLKGKDNISSNNESYQQKLDTYASTLLWNESLRQDFYKSKLDCKALKQKFGLHDLKAIDRFDAEALENRHQLLFKIAKIIWA